MKKAGLVFLALISVIFGNSQTDANIVLHTTPPFSLPSTSSGDINYIATLPSGENIVATKAPSSGIVNIKKIATNGSLSTITNLLTTKYPTGLSSSSTGNITCFLNGSPSSPGNLLKFTSGGSMLWQKDIVGGFGSSFYDYNSLIETTNGDYFITISDREYLGVIKIDSSGNALWSKKIIGPISTVKSPGFCTAGASDGGCVSTFKDGSNEGVIRLADDGQVLWSKSYTDFSYRRALSIKEDGYGNYYIMGQKGGSPLFCFLQKIDPMGNFIFAKTFPITHPFQDMYITSNNEIILLSDADSFNTIITKLDSTGNFSWFKEINSTCGTNVGYFNTYFSSTKTPTVSFYGKINDTVTTVFKFSINPIEICGVNDLPLPIISTDTAILAAEVDTTIIISNLGTITTNSTISTNNTAYFISEDLCSLITDFYNMIDNPDLNIYPNPATDFVNIELGNLNNADLQNAAIVVYDMTGRKVFEKQLNNSSMEKISTADYAAGLYTIVIANSDNILAKQRVIVQK